MYTLPNSYTKKISSGTILALLLFSGLAVLVPAIAPAYGAVNASLPSVTESPNVVVAQTATASTVTVSNPISNAWGITSFTIFAPSGWSFSNAPTACSSGALGTITASASSVQCSGTALAPGFSVTLNIGDVTGPVSPATSAPPAGAFNTAVVDGSGSGSYQGPTITIWSIASTSISVTPAGATSFTAGGSAITVTASLTSNQPGVPVVFSITNGAYPSSGYTASVSPTTVYTIAGSSASTASTTFTPSNKAKDATTITATLGNSAISSQSGTITTGAATPTMVSFTLDGNAFPSTHYERNFAPAPNCASDCTNMAFVAGGRIVVAVSDSFMNNIALSALTSPTVTVAATSAGGVFNFVGTNKSSVGLATCVNAGTGAINCGYYQSGTWGSIGALSATISGSYNGHSFSLSGDTGSIVTSTFDTTASLSAVTPRCDDCVATGHLAAGSSELVRLTLTNAQLGVPVILLAHNNTKPYTGLNGVTWVGGNAYDKPHGNFNVTVTTSGYGYISGSKKNASATGTFFVDTNAITPSSVYFYAKLEAPTDANPSNIIGPSTDTNNLVTKAGPSTGLVVNTYFDSALTIPTTHALTGASIYVDVSLVDAYGNPSTNPFSSAIQITLSTSCGSSCPLTATNVYIRSSGSDTASSFGSVQWTTSGTAPTTITLTASTSASLLSNTESLNIVSKTPTFTASAKTGMTSGSIVYSKSLAVTFGGSATVSNGYSPTLGVSFNSPGGVWYKIDNGAWALAAHINSGASWTYTAVLTSGLHTVTFMANDTNGNASPSVPIQVLVDTAAPTITAPTTLSYTAGTPVVFTIVDSEGDLNASAVTATSNSTATLTTTVTGTNNPGSPVTYTVSVSGLPTSTGHWSVKLTAADLAGNAATAVTAVVKVTVAFAQSFAVNGTPASATLGQFTGISASYTNLNPTSQSVVAFAVFKNSAGQTVGIGTGSATFGAGSTQSVFIADPVGLAAGTYSVSIFVFTTGNLPVSVTTTISVTV